jgi:hypothetical protein
MVDDDESLTPAQVAAVRPILEADYEARRTTLAAYGIDLGGEGPVERPGLRKGRKLRGELRDLQDDTREQLAEVLTEAQMEAWEALQKEQGERLRARFDADGR